MQLAQQDRVDVATNTIVEWDKHFTSRSVDGLLLCFVRYFNSKMILYGDPILIKEKPAFSSSSELVLEEMRSKIGVIAHLC